MLGPGRLVPAMTEDDPAPRSPGERGDSLEALRQAARVAEVQAGQRDAGRGRVHVGVDERRGHQRAVELDDVVDPARACSATAAVSARAGWAARSVAVAEPADPVIGDEHRRCRRMVGRVDVPVAQQRRRHPTESVTAPLNPS